MFRWKKTLLTSLCVTVIWASPLHAEKYSAHYQDAKTNEARSHAIITIEDVAPLGTPLTRITQQGVGAFDQFRDVQWTVESLIEPEHSLPVQTVCRINSDSDHNLHESISRINLSTKTIEISIRQGNDVSEFTVPLKEPYCDYAGLNSFLQKQVAGWDISSAQTFYLLTMSGKLYKVNMKFVAKEILQTGTMEIPAIKVRLIADMGILDDVFDRFVPPTFVWFEADPPHRWLKYQGMETTAGSTYVVIERQPASAPKKSLMNKNSTE